MRHEQSCRGAARRSFRRGALPDDLLLHGQGDNLLTSRKIIIEKEKTMDRLEGMTIFLIVIEKGSFSGAARELRIPVQ